MLKPFFVWQNKALKSIRPEEVVYLSTQGNYTEIYLSNAKKPYLVRSTLSGALKKLPPEIFIKTHRSYAVSIYYIDTVARDHLNLTVVVGKEKVVPIARQYYKSTIKQLIVME